MRCVLCSHEFTENDTGYVRGKISGEIVELIPKEDGAINKTGQVLNYENVVFCVSHIVDIPKNISYNLRMNFDVRKARQNGPKEEAEE